MARDKWSWAPQMLFARIPKHIRLVVLIPWIPSVRKCLSFPTVFFYFWCTIFVIVHSNLPSIPQRTTYTLFRYWGNNIHSGIIFAIMKLCLQWIATGVPNPKYLLLLLLLLVWWRGAISQAIEVSFHFWVFRQ